MWNTRFPRRLVAGSGLSLFLLVFGARFAVAAESAELRCRSAIEAGLSAWTIDTLKSRLRCQADILSGYENPSANCVTGAGSQTLPWRLADAGARLRGRIVTACSDANWGLLSFPGPCGDAAPPFGTDALARCIETIGTQTTRRLFDIWYPAELVPGRGATSDCVKGVAKRASAMVVREMRARLRCLLDSEKSGSTGERDCRGQVPPYGTGTLDESLDKAILRLQRAWLVGGLPAACVAADFAEIGLGANCPDPFGSGVGLVSFHACVFRFNRLEVPVLLDLAFPSDPVCGNSILQEGEECDDGAANSNTRPDACRLDCALPVCGDGTADPGNDEECDDGDFEDLDGCNMSCGLETCGDGIVNDLPNEVCDDGNTNPNDRCTDICSDAVCGDGVVCSDPACTSGPGGGPEICDQGEDNSASGLCHADCSGYTRSCTLLLGVTNTVSLGAITYEVKYAAVGGGDFVGAGGAVQCTSLVSGGLVSFFDNETKRTVKESLIVDAGFQAPTNIARCNYVTNDAQLTAQDFTLTVIAASRPDFEPASATMAVTSVECEP